MEHIDGSRELYDFQMHIRSTLRFGLAPLQAHEDVFRTMAEASLSSPSGER